MKVSSLCGAQARWGYCILAKGHNMGRVDIPANHTGPIDIIMLF